MAYFALVRATTSVARERLYAAAERKAVVRSVPFVPEFSLQIQLDQDTWLYAQATNSAFVSARGQIYSDIVGKSITIIHGFCWYPGDTQPLTAENLHRNIDVSIDGIKKLRSLLIGEYAILHVSESGEIVAFNDVLAMSPIHYGSPDECLVLSNRLDIAAAAAGSQPKPNRAALPELAIIGYRLTPTTADVGMNILLQEEHAEFFKRKIGIVAYDRPLYLEGIDPQGVLDPGIVEAARDEIGTSLRMIAARTGRLQIGLTGGKDSRLVLAIAMHAGLKDNIYAVTNGNEHHYDAVVAKQLAATAGVSHRVRTPGGGSARDGTGLPAYDAFPSSCPSYASHRRGCWNVG